MLLIIEDGRRKGHGAGHPEMSQGNKQRSLIIRRSNLAYDAAFITGIRQIRYRAMCLIGVSKILRLKLFDHRWRQFDFEWHGRFERGQ